MDQLTRDEALQLLNTTPVAHLGLISDGAPYVTPMSFVVDGEEILFRTMAGKKLNALRDNPNVCVEVSQFDEETGEWASVIVTGTATEVADRNKGERAVQLLFDKYANVLGDPLSRGGLQPMPGLPYLVSLKIEQITGVSSGRGFSPRTRPGRL
ncbi:MAG TPA: pyridoxamine 5'-phosphate oxidase family protein [Acidimicrobiia bacterium]|jgi:nitroimidazol reductase NimA-like FMN-containing flavoprotein (pyridoxamine 5'-phosphate oxidase superfamily)|nr:pyridoxamine 5'-phosphate oxidase family protein [Acidimicrobiia bacterium]